MSAEHPLYSNASSSPAITEFPRGDVDAERYVDPDPYGDSYMGLGGGPDPDPGCTPLLEKDYCTNFSCCGLTLADLHELVGHFEECHVKVVGPNGGFGGLTGYPTSLGMYMGKSFAGSQMATHLGTSMGTDASTGTGRTYNTYIHTDDPSSAVTSQYSSSSTPSTAPSSSLNSPISPYASPSPHPNRFPTLTSAFTPSETREGESAFGSVTIASERYGHNDNTSKGYPVTHSQNHVQCHSQNYSQEQQVLGLNFDTLLHPSAYAPSTSFPAAAPDSVVPEHTIYALHASTSTHSSRSPTSSETASADVAASSMNPQPIAPMPIYARHPSLSIITDLPSDLHSDNQITRTAGRNSNSKKRRGAPAKGPPRQREKPHKCPRSGCIKSYLNFNGLKYHLQKGTCDFDQN